jgi:invasion protein IalB
MLSKIILGILSFCMLAFLSCFSADAQQPMEGWRKVCRKQEDVDVCNTMNNIVSETGQYLTMVNLIEVLGKESQRRIGIQVPTGRFIPEGIKIKIDNGKEKVVPYVMCNASSCIANDSLDISLLDAMKKGKNLTIASMNFQGVLNPIKISLDGFSQVLNGPGMREEAFQAEQDKLQKTIRLKQQELELRMRKEQEKVKVKVE